jgi:hypothetical protein
VGAARETLLVSVEGDDVSVLGCLWRGVAATLLALVEAVAEVVFDGVGGLLQQFGGLAFSALLDALVGVELGVGARVHAIRIGARVDAGLGDDTPEVVEGLEVLGGGVLVMGEGVENVVFIGDEAS